MLNKVSEVSQVLPACLPGLFHRFLIPSPPLLDRQHQQQQEVCTCATNTQIPYIPGSSRLLIFYPLGTLVTSSREHHLPHRLRHVLRFATFTAEQFFQMIIIFHLALIGAESIICLAPPLDV